MHTNSLKSAFTARNLNGQILGKLGKVLVIKWNALNVDIVVAFKTQRFQVLELCTQQAGLAKRCALCMDGCVVTMGNMAREMKQMMAE